MRFASGFFAAIVLMILVALAVSYSGVVNVAATEQDNGVAVWFLSNTMRSSVRRQASGIAAPRQASEEEIREGFRFYNEACVYCHGAPGKDPTDIGKGLNPEPPYLTAGSTSQTPGRSDTCPAAMPMELVTPRFAGSGFRPRAPPQARASKRP